MPDIIRAIAIVAQAIPRIIMHAVIEADLAMKPINGGPNKKPANTSKAKPKMSYSMPSNSTFQGK